MGGRRKEVERQKTGDCRLMCLRKEKEGGKISTAQRKASKNWREKTHTDEGQTGRKVPKKCRYGYSRTEEPPLYTCTCTLKRGGA